MCLTGQAVFAGALSTDWRALLISDARRIGPGAHGTALVAAPCRVG